MDIVPTTAAKSSGKGIDSKFEARNPNFETSPNVPIFEAFSSFDVF
jgi:hypothetical protein